jgi:hypothetical protein
MKYDYLATVELSSDIALADMAEKLTGLFEGFVFKEDVNDRFDEVPAYIAVLDDIELILMGPPEDIEADYYLLKLYCRKAIDLDRYYHYKNEFLQSLPTEGVKIEDGGYVNVSENLAGFINSTHELECKLVE